MCALLLLRHPRNVDLRGPVYASNVARWHPRCIGDVADSPSVRGSVMIHGVGAPCIVLVIPEHWERALIRAELLERGHDAVGVPALGQLIAFHPERMGHGPLGLVVVDQKTLQGKDGRLLEPFRRRHPDVPILLLAGQTVERPRGPWNEVIVRPITIGEIVEKVEEAIVPCA